MDCSLPGCSIHGIFQARVLEWGAIAFSGAKNITSQFCSQDWMLLSSTPPWNLLSYSPLPWLAFSNLYRYIHRNKMASLWVIVFNLRTRTILHFFLKKILHFTFTTSREVLGRKNIFDLISTVLRANFVFICGCPEGIIQNRELGHQGWAEWRIWLFCLSYLGE